MASAAKAFDNGDGQGLANFIRSLRANPKEAAALGNQARRHLLDHYTPERCASRYLEVVIDCISGEGVLDRFTSASQRPESKEISAKEITPREQSRVRGLQLKPQF
jgi:hypothetical protein